MGTQRFRDLLREAIRHFADRGYASQEELNEWLDRLSAAAERDMPHNSEQREKIRREFETIFRRITSEGGMSKRIPGVSRYTIDMVMPELRAELDRRILAASDLIVLNKKAQVQKTLQRFNGWSTSIPKGGLTDIDKRKAFRDIGKSASQVKFEERRVAIDQGHKLMANVTDIVARQDGAIAMIWHSHWRQPGYDYRVDHKERDQRVYLLKDSWAKKQGLVKPGKVGYLEDITQPGQEPFCRCFGQYLTSLARIPDDMLTAKGRKALGKEKA